MIERRQRRDRGGRSYLVYRVRVGDVDRTLPRGTTRKQAEQWETKVKQLAQTGQLEQLDAGGDTLAEFVADWWTNYATTHLAHSTLETYKIMWERHLAGRIGDHRLRELRPPVIATLIADLERDGVGRPTIRKTLGLLQGILARAVEWGRMTDNPVKNVRKPTIVRDHVVRVLTPREVEALRAEMDLRDQTMISCLAYSGPRPGELVRAPLSWEDVLERTLLYHQPKTQRPPRAVRMIAALAGDLAAWRLACGGPTKGPVFPDTAGSAWTRDQWTNWHRRHFLPAARASGVDISRPYDLRHTWASLLIQEGRLTLIEVAAQMGHSVQTLLDNYAHVIAELSGEHRPVEDLIREARAPQNVPTSDSEHPHNVPTREVRGSRWTPVPLYQAKPTPGFEPGTPSLREKCSTS